MSAWDDVLTGAAAALSIAALLRRRHAVNEESRPRADLVRQRDDLPPVRHDILLLVARGEHTHRVPVWAMRQAGRYLPEFLELRRTADFFTMCQTPALAAELTLQPLRRYADLLDAVVIFSDILIVPQAMGMTVVMETGKGPTFPNPLMSPADVALLNLKPDVPATLSYLFTAISLTRKLAAEIKSVPVIGFAGGPWTLMSYMIEGGGSKTFEKSKSWLFLYPEASHTLLQSISDVIVDLLVEQWRAGASILQVFESHAGELPPARFIEFSGKYLLDIAARVRARVPAVAQGGPPLIVFARGAHGSLELLASPASAYDVIGLDWTMDPADVVARVGHTGKVFQGNLDPCELFGTDASITAAVRTMLSGFGSDTRLIGNLGHGMMPSHDPNALRTYFSAVQSVSADMRRL